MRAFIKVGEADFVRPPWLAAGLHALARALVPATDELIGELARYRRAHGLAPTPRPGETRPLVLPVIGRQNDEKTLSRGALHLILKEVFGMEAARLRARGPEWKAQTSVIASASAHWLRYSAGSLAAITR